MKTVHAKAVDVVIRMGRLSSSTLSDTCHAVRTSTELRLIIEIIRREYMHEKYVIQKAHTLTIEEVSDCKRDTHTCLIGMTRGRFISNRNLFQISTHSQPVQVYQGEGGETEGRSLK